MAKKTALEITANEVATPVTITEVLAETTKSTVALGSKVDSVFATLEISVKESVNETADIKTADVTVPNGDAPAHAGLMKLIALRTEISKAAKGLRDPLNAASKQIIAKENAVVALIETEELRLRNIRDDYRNFQEEQRLAAAKAERARIDTMCAKAIDLGFSFNGEVYSMIHGEHSIMATEIGFSLMDEEQFAEFVEKANILAQDIAAEAQRKEEAAIMEAQRIESEALALKAKQDELALREKELAEREAAIAKAQADEEARIARIEYEAQMKVVEELRVLKLMEKQAQQEHEEREKLKQEAAAREEEQQRLYYLELERVKKEAADAADKAVLDAQLREQAELEAKHAADMENARLAAIAPDLDKIEVFATNLSNFIALNTPVLGVSTAEKLTPAITTLNKVVTYLRTIK